MAVLCIGSYKAVFGVQIYTIKHIWVGNTLLRGGGTARNSAARVVVRDKVERQRFFMIIRYRAGGINR